MTETPPAGPAATRRTVLAGATAALAGSPAALLADDRAERLLEAYADTVLPRDETPSATDLGAHRRIIGRMAADPRFADIVRRALGALDAAAEERWRIGFDAADPDQREALVGLIADLPETDLLGWFFIATRAELFLDYYGRAAAWPGLGFDGPPQHDGFPDAASPPAPL